MNCLPLRTDNASAAATHIAIRQTIRSVRLKERFKFSLWMQKLEGDRYPRFSMHKYVQNFEPLPNSLTLSTTLRPHSETCRNPRLVRTSSFGFSLPTMRCSPTFNGQGKTATVTPTTAATSAQHVRGSRVTCLDMFPTFISGWSSFTSGPFGAQTKGTRYSPQGQRELLISHIQYPRRWIHSILGTGCCPRELTSAFSQVFARTGVVV